MPFSLSATPDGGITHNATIHTADTPPAELAKLTYRRTRDVGAMHMLTADAPTAYTIAHRTGSGRWAVHAPDAPDNPLITAYKPKWHRNDVVIRQGDAAVLLSRPTIKNRNYILTRVSPDVDEKHLPKTPAQSDNVGSITAESSVRRSYQLDADDLVSKELLVFAYWLVSLLNRRANDMHRVNAANAAANS